MSIPDLSNSKKTKKVRNKNNINTSKLWNVFDNEIKNCDNIECVYDKSTDDFCELCKDKLIIGENKLLNL